MCNFTSVKKSSILDFLEYIFILHKNIFHFHLDWEPCPRQNGKEGEKRGQEKGRRKKERGVQIKPRPGITASRYQCKTLAK